MPDQPPTARQLAYLKALANKTGTTFTYPHSSRDASHEIQRLRQHAGSGFTFAEQDDTPIASGDASAPQAWEIDGHGSHATWSQRR